MSPAPTPKPLPRAVCIWCGAFYQPEAQGSMLCPAHTYRL